MTFKFGEHSSAVLATVKPELQTLARRAITLSSVDFAVVQGARTLDEQMRLYGLGRTVQECVANDVPREYSKPVAKKVTWTLHSNHIGGNAIDVAPYIHGSLNWDNEGTLGLWPAIAAAFHLASVELHTPVYWGGSWNGTKDRPHFSLLPG